MDVVLRLLRGEKLMGHRTPREGRARRAIDMSDLHAHRLPRPIGWRHRTLGLSRVVSS